MKCDWRNFTAETVVSLSLKKDTPKIEVVMESSDKSNYIPKMAVRTLKKTAIGNIRSTENPNKTIQNSEKLHMLCVEREDLFSEKETWFANRIFYHI